jgi:hypothetical protein
MSARITVVIASACAEERGALIRRACASVLAGNDGLGRVLVVANGPTCAPEIVSWLVREPGVELIRLKSGSHPLARRVGAELAATDYISFLDDDDEYLSDSLWLRVSFLDTHPDVDVLVTNGLAVNGTDEIKIIPPSSTLSTDPIVQTFQHGWQSAMLTLRRDSVDLSVLDPELRHFEWTYTALLLALSCKIAVQDVLTFRYYCTPGSLSQTDAHLLAEPEFWRRALSKLRGSTHESLARVRLGQAYHDAAAFLSSKGALRDAVRYHVRGLACPGGFRRFGLTARLAAQALRAAVRRMT